jgi:hypothetical protein
MFKERLVCTRAESQEEEAMVAGFMSSVSPMPSRPHHRVMFPKVIRKFCSSCFATRVGLKSRVNLS